MPEPAQQNKPKHAGHDEVHERRDNPALDQLTQARDEKAHQRGNDITRRTLLHNNLWEMGRFQGNYSVWLDNHKGSLPVTCQANHYGPVRVQLTDNLLKFSYAGNGLPINLFDDISRPDLLRDG